MNPFNPLTWFRWAGEFIQAWFLGIPWNDAPKAIPAIILSIILFITGFIAFSDGGGWRNRLLDRQRQVALARDDYPTAEIVIRRQLEAEPDSTELIHRFALIRDAQTFTDEAEVLMRKLLRRRYVPSAKWILQNRMLGQKWTDFDEQELADAGLALKLISEDDPKNVAVKKMYAEYLIFEKRIASAIPVLDELSEFEPMLGLQAANFARQLNKDEEAQLYASKALERVEEMLADDPTNAYLVLSIARSQIFLNRYTDAIGLLRSGLTRAKKTEDATLLQQALGDAIVAYVTYIEQSPTDTIRDRLRVLKMLEVAVQLAPNNPRVIAMVADHVLSGMNEDDQELVSVREALVKGSPSGIAHFIKGTTALLNDEHDMAGLHLEKAAEQLPKSPAILNNLAVALSMRPEPDYERALKVSNEAIGQMDKPSPYFHETRGQILYRMGRFRECITDLERALAAPSLAKKTHELLAECYQHVGDQELAVEHRKAADAIEQTEQTDAPTVLPGSEPEATP